METNSTISLTIEQVISVFDKRSEILSIKEIKNRVANRVFNISELSLFEDDSACAAQPGSVNRVDIDKAVETIIKADKKREGESMLIYSKHKYKQRPRKSQPGGADVFLQQNDFIGRAGECAVMSELLFRGYNVNHMLVDGGIDLVAFKDSTYYYIQVKTVTVKNGTVQASIPLINYERNAVYSAQMRYFIVARYMNADGVQCNHFFMFTHAEIDKLLFDKSVKRGENNVVIKIRFNSQSGKPVLYNESVEDKASWHYNNFKL